MGVHVLATNLAQQDASFEPQRQFNWNFEICGISDTDTISLSLAQGFLPRISNEPIAIPYGNEMVYVAGKAVYDAGTLVLRDWVDKPTASLVMGWKFLVHDPRTGRIGLARNYKKECYIQLFGPNTRETRSLTASEPGNVAGKGTFLREWRLIGCWPETVNCAGNGLDMAQNGVTMIECVIRYDKAIPVGDLTTNGAISEPNVITTYPG